MGKTIKANAKLSATASGAPSLFCHVPKVRSALEKFVEERLSAGDSIEVIFLLCIVSYSGHRIELPEYMPATDGFVAMFQRVLNSPGYRACVEDSLPLELRDYFEAIVAVGKIASEVANALAQHFHEVGYQTSLPR